MLIVTLVSSRGVFTPTIEDEEVSNETHETHETHEIAINGTATDSEKAPQPRKPRGFACVVQSLVDDIIKPSNQEDEE